jgi:hypothetical protein
MNPELKAKIDKINSMNVSTDMKTALFAKLMEGVKAQYPPAPQRQPGLMDGFAMEGINDPDPISTRPQPTQVPARPNENDTSGGGLLGRIQEYMGSPATGVDEYLGITPKPDPNTLPPRPKVSRGPFESPDPTVPRPDPNAPSMLHNYLKPASEEPLYGATAGGINQLGKLMSKPLTERWETAIKTANPVDIRTAGGSANLVNPLPPEQNRAAIRAALPGAQGLVATGGYPAKGMQSGTGPGQIPTMPDIGIMSGAHSGLGTPGNEYRDPATFLKPPQAQPNGRPMPLGAGVSGTGGVIDAHRAKQQQIQQAQQQEKIKQQQMDKNGRFGISGYFDKLFNDPSRMAMLQGGLTMLDPRSYEDREGFSSPWTGLRAGMGAAGKGYQGVKKQQMEERKSESEIALAGAKTLKNMSELEVDDVMTRTKHSSVVKGHYIDKYQMALDIKGGMSQRDAFNKNSFKFGSDAYDRKTRDLNRKTDASIAQIDQLLNDPNAIDWNTVGIPGDIKELFETVASWTGMDTELEAGKLRLTADWIQSMAWRDLVGSGQLSVADYGRLKNMLGTRSITDTPEKVRLKFQKAMKFLKDSRKGTGTFLQSNTNPDGSGKLPTGGAPDLSILYDDDVWSPEDENVSKLYNNF